MKTLKTLLPLACVLLLPLTVFAAPIAYPFRVTDNSGTLVAGATVAIGATALTSGSATTVPTAAGEKLLSTNAAPAATVSVTLLDYGTGDYALVYDPAVNGELYVPLTVSKAGSTITGGAALIALVAAADSSTIVGVNTKTSLIATNAADSPNAVTAQAATNTTGTAVTALPANTSTAVWGAATKTVTGGTVTTVTNAVVLPTTPPTGYGGSTGDTPGTTSLLAKIGTPAGASLSADVAAVKSDTGSLVTNVASLPAANATAVWGSTTRALTDKANFALVSTEYANIAAVTTTYGFDGPPAGTILTLTITRNGSSQPVLTWTADPAATLYKVYRSTDGANYTVIATPATGTLTYTDTARPAGATVYYHITSTH